MRFVVDEDQSMIRETFRRFFTKESPASLVRDHETTGHSGALWAKLVATGVLDLDGSEAGLIERALVAHELGRALAPVDRPPVNAMDVHMFERLYGLFRSVHEASDVRCVLLTSASERVFSAGAEMKNPLPATNYGAAGDFMRLARESTMSVYDCPVPVVGAARGAAVGAGAIILALGDLVVGGPGTIFALPEVDRGVVGGSRSMARLLPEPLMRRMMFLGTPVNGEELNRALVFTEYVNDELIVEMSRRLAAQIAAKDPLSVRCTTQAIKEVEMLDVKLAYRVEQKYTVMMRGVVRDERFVERSTEREGA
jgi:enoyl-CoA hydratase